MKKILYITYYFPPAGGIASIRAVKHVKYLREFGIESVVLAVNIGWTRLPRDKSLLADIPQSTTIHRVSHPDVNWLFKLLYGLKLCRLVNWLRWNIFYPEPECTWLSFAKRRISRIMRDHGNIRAVLISSGPFSSLDLGLFIKQRYGIDYICEFRDHWIDNPMRLHESYPRKVLHREKLKQDMILRDCAGVVYLTAKMHQEMCDRMPYLVTKPYQIISNGYDEVDFTGSETHQYQPRLRMVYFGSFYDHQQPDILWRAISHLTTEGIIDQNTMEVQIIGNNTPRFVLRSYSRSPYLTRIVGFSGFQSHRLSCREMMKADILLLYIAGGRQSDFVLTGKLFSYIRSGRPILAIVPENGLAAEIIRTSKTGFIADSLDIDAICQQLSRIYHLWQNRSLDINPDWQYIAQFSNRNHADKLASLIYSCIRES